MGRPSNPKLMARVLEAVTHLAEGKGSLTRDVLDFVKQNSSGPKRNITMQVRRALKHAVNAGLLRCKSGRYKMQLALNPIPHHQPHHREDKEVYKHAEALDDMKTEPPIGGTDPSRKVQDRRKPIRKKRAARKSRKRSTGRSTKRKVTKRRVGTMEKRGRKVAKRSRRKISTDEMEEDWPTRRRRMMSKSRFDDEADDDDEEEDAAEEDEEEEDEDGEEEEDEEYTRGRRDGPKMKSVNEDSASNMSGDSNSVGRHRSRRSKHLASDRRSPSKRGNGDSEGHRKPPRRSTSRRRSQQRQRENRRDSGAEEVDEHRETMDDEPDNENIEMDEDHPDVEQNGGPTENQGIE